MNSGLKTALLLLALGGMVFGVTVIGSYTGGFKPPPEGDIGGGGGETAVITGPPLEFSLTEVAYRPDSDDLLVRAYPGFFEVSPELNYQSFWFKQPHPKPVRVSVRGRSCTACTSARVGTLPADPLADYVKQVKEGKVPPPFGSAEAITASLLAAGVSTNSQIKWEELDFDHKEKVVTLPAASPERPLVGLVQMIYKVTVQGQKRLDAGLAADVQDGPSAPYRLSVTSFGMPAFRLLPTDGKIPLGDLPEGMAPRTVEVVCWSSTRRRTGSGNILPPPTAAVVPPSPFFEIGTPVPVPDADLSRVAAALEMDKLQPQVLSAYLVPVTIHRTRPASAPPTAPPEPDIGPFERQVAFAVPGEQSTQVVALSGTVTGLVSLPADKAIDLKSFTGQTGCPAKSFELVSDRPGLKLAVAAAECKPKYVTVKLGEPEDRNGRRYWTLSVAVPPGVCQEIFPADSVVVLTADTGDGPPRKVKMPLKGQGYARGR